MWVYMIYVMFLEEFRSFDLLDDLSGQIGTVVLKMG